MNELKDSNGLYLSWCDSQWLPILNQSTVLDYFSERSNPFYDRTCNNEILKMQRLSHEQLNKFTGIEYILLHVQEPILYVIRKQDRHSPSQVTPIADYYIIAGVVYQAPDLNSLINSRILSTVHHLQSAFDESYSYSRYHPSKSYWWEFSKDGDKDTNKDRTDKSAKDKTKEEATSSTKFQRKRVDILLSELAKKFPPKLAQTPQQQQLSAVPQQTQQTQQTNDKPTNSSATNQTNDIEIKTEIKTEKLDPINAQNGVNSQTNSSSFRPTSAGPPEKKQRIN